MLNTQLLNNFIILTLNYKTHPIERIEKAYIKDEADFLDKAIRLGSLYGLVLIQTCNRVEIYLDVASESAIDDIITLWMEETGDNNIRDDILRYQGYEAIEHLFRLVAGLESMAVGENEIFHQVREGYKLACKIGAVSKFLNYVFQEAFKVGRIVRNRTYIGRRRVSMADLAVAYCEDIVGDLNDRVIIVVGAGEIGSKVVEALTRRRDRKLTIVIANRTYERAISLATKVRGIALHLNELDDYLKIADVVFVTTRAPHYILTKERIQNALGDRQKPLIIIDLSLPSNVDPVVSKFNNVKLVSIENLRTIAEKMDLEKKIILAAEKYIQDYAWKTYIKFSTKWIEDIIKNIYIYAEEVRNEAVERALKQLKDLNAEDRLAEVLDRMTKSMIKKILHPYCELMREMALIKNDIAFNNFSKSKDINSRQQF